jgi:hypothetical protein
MSKVQRHWRWLRKDGLSAYLEEHDLNPLVRVPRDLRKVVWERTNGVRGEAVPLFIVGVQRSGTNMLTHGLEMAPDVRVYNEGNSRAFTRFRLKSASEIEHLIACQRSRVVVFKPLCDSHRIVEILGDIRAARQPKGLWVWRNVTGRVRSAVSKFPTSNLRVLRNWSAGVDTGHWQVQRLSADSRAFIESIDPSTMSVTTAAALFWYVRNRLFFELGVHKRSDVMAVSYDLFLRSPAEWMQIITDFARIPYRPDLVAHVKTSLAARHRDDELVIDPRVMERCMDLTDRLLQVTTSKVIDAAHTPTGRAVDQ